jgi:hypothetical protein
MYWASCQENFSRGERGEGIFDFTATRKVTAKTEKKMKSLVIKSNVDYLLSKVYVYYIL